MHLRTSSVMAPCEHFPRRSVMRVTRTPSPRAREGAPQALDANHRRSLILSLRSVARAGAAKGKNFSDASLRRAVKARLRDKKPTAATETPVADARSSSSSTSRKGIDISKFAMTSKSGERQGETQGVSGWPRSCEFLHRQTRRAGRRGSFHCFAPSQKCLMEPIRRIERLRCQEMKLLIFGSSRKIGLRRNAFSF
jgi:hypothetical protein